MMSPPEISSPHSLPFPAGPLLRPATAAAGTLAAADHPRTRLALAVLRQEFEAVQQMTQPISKLTALVAHSTLDWAAHEPLQAASHANSQPGHGRHPAASLLLQWENGAGQRGGDRTAAEHAAVNFFGDNLDNRWSRGRDGPPPALPRPLPADTVRIAGATEPARPASPGGSISPEVDAVLAEPGGGWRLLGCLFLRLWHAQLAWLPSLVHSASLKQALYAPALQVLQQIARAHGEHAPTAAGLVLSLPRIAPYWEPVNAGAWLPVDLPACFQPELLGPPEAAMKQARRMLAHRPGLARQLDAVQALALDVSALLTDLATEPGLGLAAAHHAQRESHLRSGGKQWKQALKKGSDADIASLRTDKAFAADALLPRKAQLLTLATWMATRGSAFAHQAARDDALPPLPLPTQPAPARPAAGEL